MSDFLTVIMARVTPSLAAALAPVVEELRVEYGGREVYIASPRTQRQRDMRAALQRDSAAAVAQRYRVSRRTAQRLAREQVD